MKRNRKSKVQHTVLERRTLQIKSKTMMSWGLRKKNRENFLYRLFCPKENFLAFVFYLNV